MVLVLLRVGANRSEIVGIYQVELVITVIYATVLILTAPTNIILSRFTSDLVYNKAPKQIAPPVRILLGLTLLAMSLMGLCAMLLLRVPPILVIGGSLLTAIVSGQWVLLSLAGGLSSPGIILRAFALGAPTSVISAIALSNLGPAGYLYGFGIGQLLTMGYLYVGSFRSLPREEDSGFSISSALSDYRLLGASALALQLGIWIDKLVIYFLHGATFASAYAAMAALAWLTVVPTSAYLFLLVETSFYRSFRSFYGGIERGAPLEELDAAATAIDKDASRILLSTTALQLVVTALALAAASHVVGALGLDIGSPWVARFLLLGATLQVVSMCATLLLCYFDFQREAMAAAMALFLGNLCFTYFLDGLAPAGAGYLVAAALSSATAVLFLRLRLAHLVRDTYQGQPYGSER